MTAQAQCFSVGNVVAPEILNRAVAGDLQIRRGSCHGKIHQNFSSPALVVSREKLRELPQLRSVPLNRESEWCIVQSLGALPCPGHLQASHIVQIQIGAERLRL